MAYQPIENYGVIGNMRTAALVGMNGSIDWYCFPAFDSPSVFGAILDDKKGGQFSIAPATEHAAKKQLYWPDTKKDRLLADPPPPAFVEALKQRGVRPLNTGQVLVATRRSQEKAVRAVLRELRLPWHVLFNQQPQYAQWALAQQLSGMQVPASPELELFAGGNR